MVMWIYYVVWKRAKTGSWGGDRPAGEETGQLKVVDLVAAKACMGVCANETGSE